METIPRERFEKLLKNVKHRDLKQARSLVSLIWMTGARPNEVLSLTRKDFYKEKSYLIIKIPGSKKGVARRISLPFRDPLVKEVWNYVKNKFPDFYVFFRFRSNSKRKGSNVRLKRRLPDGSTGWVTKKYDRSYPNLANRLHYWFLKWFDLPSYYFRHNRFTIMSETQSLEQVRIIKGARDHKSVFRYLHQTAKATQKSANSLIK